MSFGSFNSNEGDTVTIPSHSIGDTIFIWVARADSHLTPTVPSGWKCAGGRAFAATTKTFMCFYKLAQTASETSGTWANAQFMVAAVYSASDYVIPIGQSTSANGTASTTVIYGQIFAFDASIASGFRMQNASAFIVGCSYAKQNAAGIESPPSGMTNLASEEGASSHHVAIHETTTAVSSWSQATVVVGSAIDWITLLVELSDTGIAKAAGGGVRIPNIRGGADQ